MKIKFLMQLSLVLFSLVFFVTSCNEDTNPNNTTSEKGNVASFSAEASLEWNKIFLEIERYAAGYRPGPAPRALALLGLASYEACVTGMPEYQSIKTLYSGLDIPAVQSGKTYHWPTVVHSIYSTMIPKFFVDANGVGNINPTVKLRVDALINRLNDKYLTEVGKDQFELSKAYGQAVALAVWNWSTTDKIGEHLEYPTYQHYLDPFQGYDWTKHTGPGKWAPIFPGPGKPMGAIYGGARTFAVTQKLCNPPSLYGMTYSEDPKSEYYAQALEAWTKNASTDYYTKWVGEFWSDDLVNLTFSPGPRWIAIANQIIENEKSNLETAIFAYVKTGMAISDAAVACWYSKYYYNIERPATYIVKFIDPNYKSNLNNPLTGDVGVVPSFPAYPSGHSTMGGAGAEALASVFGYSYAMTDKCHDGRTEFVGTPRSFHSLYEMAQENAWSRVLLGTHWRMDCEEGVRFGTEIGRAVNRLPWKK